MAITKQDIDNVSLKVVHEGYDPEEVDLLLERIAEEVDSFNRTLSEAAARVESAEARARAAEQQASQSAQMAQSTQSSQQTIASERQIAQALIAAQKTADELKEAARVEAEKAYREAEKRARDIVRDALSEKQHIIDEIDRLRESTEAFRSEYMAILGRFTSEAQKAMPKLEDVKPDVELEKKTTSDAIVAIQDADAAFEAPAAPRPEPVFQEAAPAAIARGGFPEPSVQASDFKAEAPTSGYDNRGLGQTAPSMAAPLTQSAFDFDDDIDIEEID